ncbi:MAG: cytochrome P450 [Aeromicrobium sp.]
MDAHYTPRSGSSWRAPWPMYAALREHDPVHRVIPDNDPSADYWVLSRHHDVYEAARDPETFSSASGLTTEYDELDKIGLRDNPPFVMQDPPVHTDFRRLVSRGFTPRQVSSVEPAVRAFVVDRLDRLAEAGEGDIVAELFKPLPTMVVAHYLGVPLEDRDRFDDWTHAIVAASSAGHPLEAMEAVSGLMTYFTELAERRRHDPEDDTISHLVASGVADEVDGLLSILGFAFTMVTGGNDTTTGMLGGAVQLLTSRPDQRKILVAEPDLIPDAVEELLRLTSPVQGLCRTTTRDVEIDDTTIPMGRKVLLLYGSANRDPLKYGPDADTLDVRRRPNHILTFSHGNHHCLGAAAARMQARVALEELLSRFPDFEVDIDGVEYAPGPYVRRPTRVPFRAGRR